MPLVLRELIAMRQTQSDLVEFVRQTVQVQEAAPVAEANVTDYAGGTAEISGEKPEATVGFEKVQAAVKTIAVWIPATKRALSDASQIRGIINQELTDDLNEEFEDQLINGNGVGEKLYRTGEHGRCAGPAVEHGRVCHHATGHHHIADDWAHDAHRLGDEPERLGDHRSAQG